MSESDEKHDDWNESIITEDELTDMFGEGGKEEVKEHYLEDDPLFEVEKENAEAAISRLNN